MTTRCKFTLLEKTECMGTAKNSDGTYGPTKMFKLTFMVVTGGTPEDEAFWASTPSGELKVCLVREKAAESFETGKNYFLDLTPAD